MTSELEHIRAYFEDLHQQMSALLDGLPHEALNWRPLPGDGEAHETNSLAATVAHVAGSQRWLLGEMVAGRPANRDRDAEFRATAGDAESLQRRLADATQLMSEVLAGLTPEMLEETIVVRERPRTRRWAVLHALNHTALHLGHLQLTRQLWLARAEGGAEA